MKVTSEIAECVGLWIAEGDSKSTREVTFTNNCIELVFLFHEVISQVYLGKNKPRIYVYSPSPRKLFRAIGDIKVNYYQDRRANRTYYIYRLADVVFVKKWHEIVEQVKSDDTFYPELLRGIFAGEGNVKHMYKHGNSRCVRIAQKGRDEFIEKLLEYFDVKYTYKLRDRDYWISASQLKKLDKVDIANLHPEKEAKFRRMINSVDSEIYPKGYLKSKVLLTLDNFYRTQELADMFKRSDSRILNVLSELKAESKVEYIRRGIKVYWARKERVDELILNRKLDILKRLDTFKNIKDVAEATNVYRKTVSRRLRLLEMEGLVKNVNKKWVRTGEGRNLVCGIDEAGSLCS